MSRTYTVLTATNQNGTVNGNVPATLALTLGARRRSSARSRRA